MPIPNPELEAGLLDKRVALLRPLYNEWEDEVATWEKVTDVWASILPATGGPEENAAGRSVATTGIAVVIRYRTDIDARWRIQDGVHFYEILGIADTARRRAQLQLTCKEVV